MVIEFDATIDDFIDVTIRALERSKTLRTWYWNGVVWIFVIVGPPVYLFVSGSTIVRLAIALGAAAIAVALQIWIFPETSKGRIEKICREQIGTNDLVRIKAEVSDTGISISQMGIHTLHEWWTISAVEETDDAFYFDNRDGGSFAVRKRGFESTESKQQFAEAVKRYINSAADSMKPQEEAPRHA